MKAKFITGKEIADWKDHQKLFCDLLELKDPARLLIVHNEKPGTGKSTLLIRLKYICAKEKSVPVSLVPLEDEKVNGSFEMVQHLRNEFRLFQLPFPRFDKLNLARITKNTAPFMSSSGSAAGIVNLSAATISGGTQGGVVNQIERQENYYAGAPVAAWPNPDFERIAIDKCVEAFFEDLKEICQTQTVVLLLDSWDANPGSETVRKWIEYDLLPRHCFDLAQRPQRLVIVLAGREEFNLGKYPPEVAKSKPFKTWDLQDIKEFVALHGYEDIVDKADLKLLCDKFKEGKITVGKALGFLAFVAEDSD